MDNEQFQFGMFSPIRNEWWNIAVLPFKHRGFLTLKYGWEDNIKEKVCGKNFMIFNMYKII